MALAKLPGRPTPICVECTHGPTAYAQGGFPIHISCIPGLRDWTDILALYTRVPAMLSAFFGGAHLRCSVHPEISSFHRIGGASGLFFTNDLYILAYGGHECEVSGLMAEVSAGVDLSDIIFCVTVRGR